MENETIELANIRQVKCIFAKKKGLNQPVNYKELLKLSKGTASEMIDMLVELEEETVIKADNKMVASKLLALTPPKKERSQPVAVNDQAFGLACKMVDEWLIQMCQFPEFKQEDYDRNVKMVYERHQLAKEALVASHYKEVTR